MKRNPEKATSKSHVSPLKSEISKDPQPPQFWSPKRPTLAAATVLLVTTLAMFGDLLLFSRGKVPSNPQTDLGLYFIFWRDFGFSELLHGNLALWNPHVFCGTPSLGGFQVALLYPPNWIYMILPLATAINVDISFHVFSLGFFMYCWASRRGLCWSASLLTALLIMFGSANFLHVFAGHLTILCAAAWTPLIFLAMDGILSERIHSRTLLGIFAVAMQIYAGHPQYVFYGGVAVTLYFGLEWMRSQHRMEKLAAFFIVYLGGALTAAVQLAASAHAASESTRGGGGFTYKEAGFFSFPPENFITLLVPHFFGTGLPSAKPGDMQYWGRFYSWEMTFFFGVSGLVLALLGAIRGDRRVRRPFLPLVVVFVILAMGKYTPLFAVLHGWVPGFDRFRGNSKFIFEASIALSMLAGVGFEYVLRSAKPFGRLPLSLFVLSLILVSLGVAISRSATQGASGTWAGILASMGATNETYTNPTLYGASATIEGSAKTATKGLILCALTLSLMGGLLYSIRFFSRASYGLFLLAALEVLIFARSHRPTFDLEPVWHPEALKTFRRDHPGEDRVFLTEGNTNVVMSADLDGVSGYDPQTNRRYSEFLDALSDLRLEQSAKLLQMLRCRYVFIAQNAKAKLATLKSVLPRVQLVGESDQAVGFKEFWRVYNDPAFDPARKVILETQPDPLPEAAASQGTARVTDFSTDYLDVEADVAHPSILLVTDGYSNGWRAMALSGSVQHDYTIMPANYVLRAIPLRAGKHRIRIEFSPLAYRVGRWVSIFSIFVYGCLLAWHLRSRYKGQTPIKSRFTF